MQGRACGGGRAVGRRRGRGYGQRAFVRMRVAVSSGASGDNAATAPLPLPRPRVHPPNRVLTFTSTHMTQGTGVCEV